MLTKKIGPCAIARAPPLCALPNRPHRLTPHRGRTKEIVGEHRRFVWSVADYPAMVLWAGLVGVVGGFVVSEWPEVLEPMKRGVALQLRGSECCHVS